jgi:hypothetical protein
VKYGCAVSSHVDTHVRTSARRPQERIHCKFTSSKRKCVILCEATRTTSTGPSELFAGFTFDFPSLRGPDASYGFFACLPGGLLAR